MDLWERTRSGMRQMRAVSGLSTRQLAATMGEPQATVSHIETGRRKLKIDVLERYAAACGYTVKVAFIPKDDADDSVLMSVAPESREAVETILLLSDTKAAMALRFATAVLNAPLEALPMLQGMLEMLEAAAARPSK